ncbi:MAG: NfeD family protein [Oscillospiraceae bacterium]
MNTMTIVWAVLIVVFLIVEGATAGLTSIWFALGSIAALISNFLGAEIWLQILIFVIVSIIALLCTRPLAHKYLNTKTQSTNADRVIGSVATITQRVDNFAGTGAASVGGRDWTARSVAGEILEPGTRTIITAIEGVKLIVRPQVESETIQK